VRDASVGSDGDLGVKDGTVAKCPLKKMVANLYFQRKLTQFEMKS